MQHCLWCTQVSSQRKDQLAAPTAGADTEHEAPETDEDSEEDRPCMQPHVQQEDLAERSQNAARGQGDGHREDPPIVDEPAPEATRSAPEAQQPSSGTTVPSKRQVDNVAADKEIGRVLGP